jgi:hypothetical protein
MLFFGYLRITLQPDPRHSRHKFSIISVYIENKCWIRLSLFRSDGLSVIHCVIYREFRERRTRLTLLPSASTCETPASSAKKNYCRLALDMPCIVNTYVHF